MNYILPPNFLNEILKRETTSDAILDAIYRLERRAEVRGKM